MVWRTMEEWNSRDRYIKKGQKCLLRDPDGNCLWNKGQTKRGRERPFPSDYDRWVPTEDLEWNDRDSAICEAYT